MDLSRFIWLCPSLVVVIFPIWHRAPTVGFFSALLLSIWILFRCRRDPIHTRDWVLIAAFSAVPITTAIGLVIHDGSLSVLDRPLRLLLAVPIFIAFRTVGLNAQGLLAAAGWSAIAFGLTGIWDMTQGLERAVGEAGHPIVFGNTALLMGLICLWGLLSKASTGKNPRRMALLGVGLAAGLLASLASGSRGGWIFALPMAVFMFIATRAQHVLSFRNMAIFGAGGALLLVMFGQMVFDRLTPVVEGVRFALQSDAPPPAELLSIVARVDMWREAIYAWSQAPIFGVGPDLFLAALESRASLGYMEPGRAHAHSEVLTQLAMFGLLGLTGLLTFISGLGYAFRGHQSLIGQLGLITLCTYVLFGLTDSMFSMMNRVELYALLLAVCAGAMRHDQLNQLSSRKESQASQAGHCQA